jgi:hypothetical protein
MKLASPSEKTLAKVNDPDLWTDAVRQASREALESSDGKRSWHARAAQRASQIYKQSGGTWKTKLSKSQRLERTSLGQWEAEEWVTINPDTGKIAGPCGTELAGYEGVPLRCLPRDRYESLTPAQRKRTAIRKADAPVGENLPVMGSTGGSFRVRCQACNMGSTRGYPMNGYGCGCGSAGGCSGGCGCGPRCGCAPCRARWGMGSTGGSSEYTGAKLVKTVAGVAALYFGVRGLIRSTR